MAARNDAIVAARWVNRDGYNMSDLVEMAEGFTNPITITEIVGQHDSNIGRVPVCIFEITGLTNAQMTGLRNINRFVVLMDRQYDDVTNVESGSTYDNTPTGPQLLAFINNLKARFPGLNDDALRRQGRDIFRPGMTRRQILTELIDRWKDL